MSTTTREEQEAQALASMLTELGSSSSSPEYQKVLEQHLSTVRELIDKLFEETINFAGLMAEDCSEGDKVTKAEHIYMHATVEYLSLAKMAVLSLEKMVVESREGKEKTNG
jgi:hypothetical protein